MRELLLGLTLLVSISSFATEINTEIVNKIEDLGWKVTIEDTPNSENVCLNEQLENTLAVLSRTQCSLRKRFRMVHIYGETARRDTSGMNFILQIGKNIPGIMGANNGLHIKYTRVKYRVGRTEVKLYPPSITLASSDSYCKTVSEEDIEKQLYTPCNL